MDITAIRQGIADTFATVPGVRVFDTIPDGLPVGQFDAIVVQPDPGTYITYSAVNGLTNMNQVFLLVTIIVQSTDWRTAQNRIDQLLSCGTDQPRSLRTALGGNLSAGGTACQVIPRSAAVTQLDIAGTQHWAADLSIEVQARC